MDRVESFVSPVPAAMRWLRPDPASRITLMTIAAFVTLAGIAFSILPAHHDWNSLAPIWLGLIALFLVGTTIAARTSETIGFLLQFMAAFFGVCLLGSLTGSILATTDQPLVDAQLIAADRLLGFDWIATFNAWKDIPGILVGLSLVYSSLSWQPVIMLGLLAATNRSAAAWQFLAAWGLTLLVTMAMFPLFPAYANYLVHEIDPADVPGVMVDAAWAFAEKFDALRSGAILMIDRNYLDGLVTFPSFHTSAGILLAAGFAHLPRLAIPFCILNAVMIVSAVFIGAHYFVDILAGIAIALAAVKLAERWVPVRTA